MFDSTMRVGDMVVVTHKELPYGPDDRYYGLLVIRPRWGAISVLCAFDGKTRKFDPREWDAEVISESR
jgi:hypothetical protein